MKDALLTDLDFTTNQLIIQEYGQVHKEHQFYKVLYAFSEQILSYSYAVENLTSVPLELTLDLSASEQMISSIASYNRNNNGQVSDQVTKIVMPGQTSFMCHQMVKPGASRPKRSVRSAVARHQQEKKKSYSSREKFSSLKKDMRRASTSYY